MPQASDKLRAVMEKRFGDPISDEGPINFLKERGYKLNRDWTWSKAGISDYGQMDHDEFECALFLAHEWDFGGLKPDPKEPS